MEKEEIRQIVFECLDEYFKTKNKRFNFKQELIIYGFNEQLVNDWLVVRKTKKASNTETAFKGFVKEIERRSCNINEVLLKCVECSWSGFKWEWLDNLNRSQNGITENKQSVRDLQGAALAILEQNGSFDYTKGC